MLSHAWRCRATGQHEQADELLQRCLYVLEMALHPSFQWGEPGCRIPFEEENNRPLFSALFKHMQVGRAMLHPRKAQRQTGVAENTCQGPSVAVAVAVVGVSGVQKILWQSPSVARTACA